MIEPGVLIVGAVGAAALWIYGASWARLRATRWPLLEKRYGEIPNWPHKADINWGRLNWFRSDNDARCRALIHKEGVGLPSPSLTLGRGVLVPWSDVIFVRRTLFLGFPGYLFHLGSPAHAWRVRRKDGAVLALHLAPAEKAKYDESNRTRPFPPYWITVAAWTTISVAAGWLAAGAPGAVVAFVFSGIPLTLED